MKRKSTNPHQADDAHSAPAPDSPNPDPPQPNPAQRDPAKPDPAKRAADSPTAEGPENHDPESTIEGQEADGPTSGAAKRRVPPPRRAASGAVPALEPPVALANRFDQQRNQKQWLFDRIRESPSWLTSLVAHLALLLLLGSYIVPPGKRSHAFELLMLFSETDDVRDEGDLVLIHTAMMETEDTQDIGHEGPDLDAAEQEEAPNDDPEPESEVVEPATESEAEEEDVAEDTPPEETPVDTGDEIPTELDSLFSDSEDSTVTVGRTSRNVTVPAGLDEVSDIDQVVDLFIEYDVGRLKGKEGAEANQRFQQLGSNAIPALVRGLNKSASIRASCPVVVISQKLENELRKSGDPVMIQYAIDRLGEGVPGTAPHQGRVLSLRERLRKQFLSLEEELTGTAVEWGLPKSEAILQSATDAASMNSRQLRYRIASADPVERVGALLATSLRARRMDREQRFELGMTMIDQLARERDMRIAQVHHRALNGLAYDGSVHVPIALAANPVQHAAAWRAAWQGKRAEWRERDASQLFATARNQQRAGKTIAAAGVLRTINTDFADTSYAARAREMLGTLDFNKIASSQYNRAAILENAGKEEPALRSYRDIVERFPNTKAARLAKQRVRKLSGGSSSGGG